MFESVSMTRLRLVILERDERAVLRYLGRASVVQLTRTPAGPDTAPLSPRNRSDELARLERVSSHLENLRRSLELPPAATPLSPVEMSLEQAEKNIQALEDQSSGLLQRRQHLQQRLAETTAVSEQISDYRGFDLPLDQPSDSSFLHFVTGSLPAKTFAQLETGSAGLQPALTRGQLSDSRESKPIENRRSFWVLPLAERDGRQILIALTTRQNRPDLDRALQQAGFQPEKLPVAGGTTTTALSEQNQREQELAAAELKELNAKLQTLVEKFSPTWAQIEITASTERRLLEAEQNFPRTDSSVLVTGWVPSADVLELKQRIQEITHGRCIIETTPAEKLGEEEIPVLLRHPRLLRPFAMLVTAYGLPKYRELEPTLFVAVSYLLMFGMMFGDVGHGFVLAVIGLILLLANRRAALRDVGLLLLFGGGSSMIFGALYGSCFGIEQFKKYALWHDPLAGDPMSLMIAGIEIGIVMISLGLVLNIINRLRHGDFIGALLDKFGAAGAVFYWGALALFTKSVAIRAHGLFTPAIVLLAVLVIAWMLKEPIQIWRGKHAGHAAEPGGISTVIMESFVSVFEGLLSYFANTISFVRLAAYAMSHGALLLATFMIAADVKHFSTGGGYLSVLVIILGNLVAIVLEGIVASVQALRLEYYEFFGKFFSGGGQPFQPFRLQTTTVADTPL